MGVLVITISVCFYTLLIIGCVWWLSIMQHGLNSVQIGTYAITGLVLFTSVTSIRAKLILLKQARKPLQNPARPQMLEMLPSKSVLIFLVVLFAGGIWLLISKTSEFNQIELNMTRNQVIKLMPEDPNLELEPNSLCNGTKSPEACENALKSGASNYLVWMFGLDMFGVVGYDSENKVVFRSVITDLW